MDSMRSLDTSLPQSTNQRRSRRRSRDPRPSAELLQAFKAAALSVTQLYKTATTAAENESQSDDDDSNEGNAGSERIQEREEVVREAHDAGYQSALDDLLGFLDESEIGLGDGEGWCVREWATRRLQGVGGVEEGVGRAVDRAQEQTMKADGSDEDMSTRSASPTNSRRSPPRQASKDAMLSGAPATIHDARSSSSSPPQPHRPTTTSNTDRNQQDIFHFRSAHPLPHTRQHHNGHSSSSVEHTPIARRSPTSVRLEIKPSARATRSHTRHTGHQRIPDRIANANNTAGTTTGSGPGLGYGAGVKRKGGFMEFFDVSGAGAGDEYGGGGKRGRLG